MSLQHIEKFYEIAANDQKLFIQLMGDGSSTEQFIENAVVAGKERGLEFSIEEANTWVASQQAAKANGELSDTQLEGVAGGKQGQNPNVNYGVSMPETLLNAVTFGGFREVSHWVSTW
jgi:hypothetical protein